MPVTGLAISGANAGDYVLAATTAAGPVGTITAETVTVTANAQSRIYGNANPTLTYVSLSLMPGDTLSGALATTATVTSNVGLYGITQGTLANPNYSIAYTGANLTVTVRPITVTADAQSRVYGNANPLLTYVVGSSGLGPADTLTGLLATTATATSSVGTYAITQGTLTATSNYALTYVGANLTVTAQPITVLKVTASVKSVDFPSYFSSINVPSKGRYHS